VKTLENFLILIVAFCGGIFGASVGGLNAFILCGLASVIGTVTEITTGTALFNHWITWGPFLGPHVAFASGVAAAAYAANRKVLCSGRNVLLALFGFNKPDILIVGGLFGILGHLIKLVLDQIPVNEGIPWTNSMALSIVLSGLIARFVFGKTGIMGNKPESQNRWHRSREEAWQPWPSHPLQVLLIGLAFGLPASLIVKAIPTSAGILFGLSALTLIFFQFGNKIPVTLHVILSAVMVTRLSNSILWGLFFGLLAAILSEIFACLFLLHGDTHIDPPALSLVVTFSLYPILTSIPHASMNREIAFSLIGVLVVWYLLGSPWRLLKNKKHQPTSSY